MATHQEGLGQFQHQALKQTLSTQQIQYVKLLQMNAVELNTYLNDFHTENPVVELTPPAQQHHEAPEARPLDIAQWISHRPAMSGEHDPNDSGLTEDNQEGERFEDDRYNLQSYLRSQFDLSLTDFDLSLMERLISSLDRNGYLTVTPETLAQQGFDLALSQEAVKYLQTLDPAGIAAYNLGECLCLQLERKGVTDPVAFALVTNHLEDLAHGYFQKAAKALNDDPRHIKELYKLIRTLSPRPATGFGNETLTYIIPDVTVTEDSNGLHVKYNRDFHASLSVNDSYLKLAQESSDAKQYINRKLSQALWVIKAVESRQATIQRIVAIIVERQNSFFLSSSGTIIPLRLKDVSQQLAVHESTVSRAIHDKFLECNRGVFPLKYFFASSAGTDYEETSREAYSSRTIKERISSLVAEECPEKPLSDSALAQLLADEEMPLARRTVAKYREELGIPSSTMRKK